MADEAAEDGFRGWCILELMGHRRRAGLVGEVEMFGGKLLRIEVPVEHETGTVEFVTEYYGGGAIYSLRPCSEEVARDFLRICGDQTIPIRPVDYRGKLEPGHGEAEMHLLASSGDDEAEDGPF